MGDPKQLILIGGGGHAAVLADAVLCGEQHTIRGVLDDIPTRLADELGHLGEIGVISSFPECRWILAMGELSVRRAWLDGDWGRHEHHAVTVSHPRSTVSLSSHLEPGVFVGAGAIVQPRARVGAHAIINTGAIVEHDCNLGENVHIAPGAVLGGSVTVGDDTLIGLGARVKPGVRIGKHVTVGVGAVVVDDVPDGQTVVGVPARALERAKI